MSAPSQFQSNIASSDNTVTIDNGQTVSSNIVTYGMTLTGFITPASWTTADISFQVSIDGANYFDLYDADNNQVKIAGVAASRAYKLEPVTFAGYEKLRLISSVAQDDTRVITLSLRRI